MLNRPKAIIYCRKSSESGDQQSVSIESQEEQCLKLAERHNISDYCFLKEAKSAHYTGRPMFAGMMAKLLSGEYDTIICWKIDRLSRNPIEAGEVVDLLQRKVIKRIITMDKVYCSDGIKMLKTF